MLRYVCLGVFLLSLGACSKDKKTEEAKPGDTAANPEISQTPLNFSPQGSDSGTIKGLSTVFFEYDQARITAEAKKALNENAGWIKEHDVTTQIEGHCDERGSIEYNLALGERRAKAIKAYMVSLGIPAKKLTVISYGKEKKLAEGDSEDTHQKNRRGNFVPLPN